jgi:hypothetical protein
MGKSRAKPLLEKVCKFFPLSSSNTNFALFYSCSFWTRLKELEKDNEMYYLIHLYRSEFDLVV